MVLWGQCHSSGVQSVPYRWCSTRYMVGARHPVLVQRHLLSGRPGIKSAPISLFTLMYHAYHIRYSDLILLALSICWFSPYILVLVCWGLSDYSMLSRANQNPFLGSICGETKALGGGEPSINTPLHLSWHRKWIPEKAKFSLVELWEQVTWFCTTLQWWTMKSHKELVPPTSWETYSVYSFYDDKMRWDLSTPRSVSNGSRQSLQVQGRVGTELLPNWRFGLPIYPNQQFGYGSREVSQPIPIGRVVSWVSSGSIHSFI